MDNSPIHPQTFLYQGYKITFNFGNGNIMANATEMAKPFGKLPSGFLRNSSTQSYVNALKKHYANLHSDQILRIEIGGDNPGTWMHEELALKFAAWLSPEFEVWIYQRIKELLKKGKTEIKRDLSPAEVLHQITGRMVEQEKTLSLMDKRLSMVEAKTTTRPDEFFTIAGWCRLQNKKITLHEAATLGRKAKALSKKQNYQVQAVRDIRFGKVGAYHVDILKQII